MLVARKPNTEAKITYHTSVHLVKLYAHNESKTVYLLDSDGRSVSSASPPAYDSIKSANADVPPGMRILDLAAITAEGSEKLVGLKLLVVKLANTGYMYPAGVFGDDWKVTIRTFALHNKA